MGGQGSGRRRAVQDWFEDNPSKTQFYLTITVLVTTAIFSYLGLAETRKQYAVAKGALVSLGDYQVCGVVDLRSDFVTEWQANGTIHLDYVRCDFTKILYFEFPRKRITGEFISAGMAAQLTAQAKDNAEEILESQVEASPPPTSATAVQTLLTRYYNILNNELKAYGGRVSYNNNYGTTSVQPYTKSITGGNCN